MPWTIRRRDNQFCIYKADADGNPTGAALGCHATEAEAEAQRRALEANVTEMQLNDVLVVWELRGSYPDVPIAADVDYAALVAGDDDPTFVTLPIGKAGVTSGNQRHYDEAFVVELERQVLANKPVGLMGHLPADQRASAFPAEAVHWVGVKRIGELLWGKGYVPAGEARDRIRRYKAAGKRIATSIDALAQGVWDEGLKAYRMAADSLRLNQIDIAPADRAGIPALGAVPILTTEMDDGGQDTPVDREDSTMDKLQIINELTAADARLLPDPVRQAILDTVPEPDTPAEVGLVADLREALGLDEKADLAATVRELAQAKEQRAKQAVADRITELVNDAEKGVKLEMARPLVTKLVAARNPATPEEAETAYNEVIGDTEVQELLKAQVQRASGPNMGKPPTPNGQTAKYFAIPGKQPA